MRTKATTMLLAGLLLAAPVRAQVPQGVLARLPSVTLSEALDRVLRDYERAWSAGDADALAALFVEDGFVSAPGGWIRGRGPIRERYANASGPLRLRALEWAVEGDVGWIVGAYGYGPTADELDAGKFVLALRRGDDGRWLIAADLDNSNMRPGG